MFLIGLRDKASKHKDIERGERGRNETQVKKYHLKNNLNKNKRNSNRQYFREDDRPCVAAHHDVAVPDVQRWARWEARTTAKGLSWWWYLRWSFHKFQIAWPDSNPFPGFLPSLISYTWLETRLGFQLHLFQFRFSIFIPVLFPIWSLQLEVQGGDLSDVCRLQNLHSYDGSWEQGTIIVIIVIIILAPGNKVK